MGRSPGEGKGYHSSILAWRVPWGSKESDTTKRPSPSPSPLVVNRVTDVTSRPPLSLEFRPPRFFPASQATGLRLQSGSAGALGRASPLPTPSWRGGPPLPAIPAHQRLSIHNSRTGIHTSKVTPTRDDSPFVCAWTRQHQVNGDQSPVTAKAPPRGRRAPPRVADEKAQRGPQGSEAKVRAQRNSL